MEVAMAEITQVQVNVIPPTPTPSPPSEPEKPPFPEWWPKPDGEGETNIRKILSFPDWFKEQSFHDPKLPEYYKKYWRFTEQIILLRIRKLESFMNSAGSRYYDATFDKYSIEHKGQSEAVDACREYIKHFKEYNRTGSGLILFGPSGTGKDHLGVATIVSLILDYCISGRRISGAAIFKEVRSSMHGWQGDSEDKIISDLIWPDILLLSDPVALCGSLTDFQASVLYSIIDQRYNDCSPTIVTMNVASGLEADTRLGSPILDRLRDGAITIKCDWPSYRKVAGQVGRESQ